MLERSSILGIPESKLNPDYWAGHALDDSCPSPEAKASLKNLIPDRKRNSQDAWARQELRAFISAPQAEVTRVFMDEGEVFDFQAFPAGTLVRINHEQLGRRILGPEGIYFRTSEHLAVVLPESEGIISFPIFGGKPDLGLPTREKEPIKIGAVEHWRMEFRYARQRPSDCISKTMRVELLKYGRRTPEQVRRRRFIPHLQHQT